MIITAGHEQVAAVHRDAVVPRFSVVVSRAGCSTGASTLRSPPTPSISECINTIKIWRDATALDAWRELANAPDADEITHLDVRRYDAVAGGPLF